MQFRVDRPLRNVTRMELDKIEGTRRSPLTNQPTNPTASPLQFS